MALNNFPKNEDIMMNSVGSAISPRDIFHSTRNQDKKVKFSFSKRAVSIDPSVANKILRPIRSIAYENAAKQQSPINVINHKDSTNLLKKFVKESKYL